MNLSTSRHAFAASAVLFAAVAAATLALRPPLPIDETRYLTVAWEMWRDGTWLVPHLNGAIYGDKPPLLFWLIGLVWSVAGVGGWEARLVGPAVGLGVLAATWALARRLWPDDPRRAGASALILATTLPFLLFATATMFDGILALAAVLAVGALVALRGGGGRRAILGLGAALALGVYAKGPVILVHVGPAALLLPVWADAATRPPYGRWLRDLGLALLVALALVGLWLVPALVLGGPEYRAEVLWRQSAGRMVHAFAHQRPAWFFLALLPLYLWPWGWSRAGLSALSPARVRADESARLAAVWAVSAVVAFSLISGKQIHYLVPELPALALLLSGLVGVEAAGPWEVVLPLAPLGLVGGLVGAAAAGWIPEVAANGSAVTPAGAALGLALLALPVLAARAVGTRAALALAAPCALLGVLVAGSPLLVAGYDPGPIARAMAAGEPKGLASADVVYHGQFNFAGRLSGPVAHLTDPAAIRSWARAHPGGLVVTREAMDDGLLEPVLRRKFNGKAYVLYRVPEATP